MSVEPGLVALMPGTDEWENAFWTDMLSTISMSMDDLKPGYTTRLFNEVEEDRVLEIFEKTLKKAGFIMAMDAGGLCHVVKMPSAQVVASKLVKEGRNLNDNLFFQKCRDISCGGIEVKEDLHSRAGEHNVLIQFDDGSRMKRHDDGTMAYWKCNLSFNEDSSKKFFRALKTRFDAELSKEHSVEVSKP